MYCRGVLRYGFSQIWDGQKYKNFWSQKNLNWVLRGLRGYSFNLNTNCKLFQILLWNSFVVFHNFFYKCASIVFFRIFRACSCRLLNIPYRHRTDTTLLTWHMEWLREWGDIEWCRRQDCRWRDISLISYWHEK